MLNRAACTGACLASAGIVEGCREECKHLSAPNPGGLTEAQRSLARTARGTCAGSSENPHREAMTM